MRKQGINHILTIYKIKMLKELIKYRDLLLMLTLRDIKIRYKQSFMGYLWAIFMPIVAILAGILIKAAFAFVAHQPFDLKGVASIAVKVLPWTFFVNAVKFSVQGLVGNRDLVAKIYFPREVLPFASIFACLFDLFVAGLTLTIILVFAGIGISINLLWLPLLLLFFILLTAGLSLVFSSANL
ncbi:MAG: ABC transporter permease [Candidatus Omnitrophica bacterium]|nr:ABC transporter permease [Candidatus Omnitrophota bacterium]